MSSGSPASVAAPTGRKRATPLREPGGESGSGWAIRDPQRNCRAAVLHRSTAHPGPMHAPRLGPDDRSSQDRDPAWAMVMARSSPDACPAPSRLHPGWRRPALSLRPHVPQATPPGCDADAAARLDGSRVDPAALGAHCPVGAPGGRRRGGRDPGSHRGRGRDTDAACERGTGQTQANQAGPRSQGGARVGDRHPNATAGRTRLHRDNRTPRRHKPSPSPRYVPGRGPPPMPGPSPRCRDRRERKCVMRPGRCWRSSPTARAA